VGSGRPLFLCSQREKSSVRYKTLWSSTEDGPSKYKEVMKAYKRSGYPTCSFVTTGTS